MAKYNLNKTETIKKAIEIARDMESQGLKLSLRQLFYRFVALDLEENTSQTYKRLGGILTEARYSGEFPFHYLEDRGRYVGAGDWTENDVDVDEALEKCESYVRNFAYWTITRSKWWGQPNLVSVWVEKDALSGVFEDPCSEAGVPLFACKGYPSAQSLYDWHKRMVRAIEQAEENDLPTPDAVVLYFGDHDPEGFDIPRSSYENLKRIQTVEGEHFEITFERIGLNREQIEEHNPPPSYAKTKSARYEGYCDDHSWADDGDGALAWELDALHPSTLRDLIRENIGLYFDGDVDRENKLTLVQQRDELREKLREKLPGMVDEV